MYPCSRYYEKNPSLQRRAFSLPLMHIGMDWREECGTSAERNGERLQSPLRRLLCAIGLPPQQRAILTFEQAGRDFKKLLITTE